MACFASLAIAATIAAAMYTERVEVRGYWEDDCDGDSFLITITKYSPNPDEAEITVSYIEQQVACNYRSVKSFKIVSGSLADDTQCYPVPVCKELLGW